jgi:hypothetical protein
MSTCYLPSRLKKWSFLFFLFILLGGFAAASTGFAACEYLSEDFSSAAEWAADQKYGHWTISNGMLDVENTETTSTYAKTAFYPDNFFTADVRINIVSSSDRYTRVGIRFRTSGDVLFGVQGDNGQITTNGVLCYYYPTAGLLKFKVYDMVAGEWVTPIASRSVSVKVASIGLNVVADGVIFRLNGQDTNYKLSGNFSFPSVVDHLYLYAGGTGLHARFDNVCASAGEVGDFLPGNAMPVPGGREVLTAAPAASPAISIVPASASPLGLGAAASGGGILSLTAGLSGLAAPMDLYVGIGVGSAIFLFDSHNRFHSVSEGFIKWRANTTGGFNNVRLLPDIDLSAYPGTYTFYFIMAPAGHFDAGNFNSFRLWVTPLVVNGGGGSGGGGSSTVTDHAMEQEIKQNINLIFGLTSGFPGGLTEAMSIFQDKNVVTFSPPLDSVFASVMHGAPIPSPITINANLGSGYRMKSGAVMAGSARIVLSKVQFSATGMGADFSANFNNVTKDGAPFVNGHLSGNILMTKGAGETSNISGRINISSLSVSGQPMSGTIDIAGTVKDFDLFAFIGMRMDDMLKTTGNIRLTFTNFTSGAYTITGGYVDINSTRSGHATISTNLQTSQGPVTLNMTSTASATSAVINTTAPGTAGPYTVSIANVTMNQNTCANYPTGGTVSFTSHSTGKTGVVTFTGACDGTYRYTEQ